MGLFRRTSEASRVPSERQADELADRADDLAESEPDSKRATTAAQQSLDAAEARLRASDTVAERRRVGRALWRQGLAIAQGDRPATEFVAGAQRCWLVSRQAVELTGPQDPLRDVVIGELMQRAATFVVPVLSEAGYPNEAGEVMEFCDAAGESSQGPRAEQGRARLTLMVLTTLADQHAQARLSDRWDDARAQQAAALRMMAQDTTGQLRRYQDDGPLEVTELANALRALSRLMFVGGEIDAANGALDEAIRLSTSVADRGPNQRKFLQSLKAERDSLDEYARITSSSGGSTPEPGSTHPAAAPAGPAGDWTAPELLADYIAQIDHGIALSRAGELRQAQAVLTSVAGALDLLWRQDSAQGIDVETVRQLARARWRLAMVEGALGNHSQALTTGLLAVQSGRGWLTTLPAGTDQRAEAVAEVATIAVDTAEMAFGAREYDEGLALLKEAISLCRRADHPAVRRVLGTALHNSANALLAPIGSQIVDPFQVRGQVRRFQADALEAVTLRRELRAADDPVSWFELANSLLLLSIATAMQNDPDLAATLLAEAVEQARPLAAGTGVNAFRSRAQLHGDRLAAALSTRPPQS